MRLKTETQVRVTTPTNSGTQEEKDLFSDLFPTLATCDNYFFGCVFLCALTIPKKYPASNQTVGLFKAADVHMFSAKIIQTH